MKILNWIEIGEAFTLVVSNKLKRVDGEGWIIYKVGNIIRIDIEDKK